MTLRTSARDDGRVFCRWRLGVRRKNGQEVVENRECWPAGVEYLQLASDRPLP